MFSFMCLLGADSFSPETCHDRNSCSDHTQLHTVHQFCSCKRHPNEQLISKHAGVRSNLNLQTMKPESICTCQQVYYFPVSLKWRTYFFSSVSIYSFFFLRLSWAEICGKKRHNYKCSLWLIECLKQKWFSKRMRVNLDENLCAQCQQPSDNDSLFVNISWSSSYIVCFHLWPPYV